MSVAIPEWQRWCQCSALQSDTGGGYGFGFVSGREDVDMINGLQVRQEQCNDLMSSAADGGGGCCGMTGGSLEISSVVRLHHIEKVGLLPTFRIFVNRLRCHWLSPLSLYGSGLLVAMLRCNAVAHLTAAVVESMPLENRKVVYVRAPGTDCSGSGRGDCDGGPQSSPTISIDVADWINAAF